MSTVINDITIFERLIGSSIWLSKCLRAGNTEWMMIHLLPHIESIIEFSETKTNRQLTYNIIKRNLNLS
uniref:Uncharacterized protein n=1 Tax=Parascaris equorum TaxID=6256 RepID=A0A914RU83_PAREQ